ARRPAAAGARPAWRLPGRGRPGPAPALGRLGGPPRPRPPRRLAPRGVGPRARAGLADRPGGERPGPAAGRSRRGLGADLEGISAPNLGKALLRQFLRAVGVAGMGAAMAACASEPGGGGPGGGQEAAGQAPSVSFTEPRTKLSGDLKILLWSHFVP